MTVAIEILFLDHERQQQDYGCSIDYKKQKPRKGDEDIMGSNESNISILTAVYRSPGRKPASCGK
jgi:hypothetical protein